MFYFLYFTKSRKKLLLGRAKSCRWQVFVRRRPPKQGELRTDVSKATMFQGDRKVYKGGFAAARCRKVAKGFNFVSAKPPLRRAESRFAEPRCSLQRERVYSFRLYEKNQKYPRGLRTSGLRGRFKVLSEILLEILPTARAETGFSHKTAAKRL